jgi:hypothetical protein
MKVIICGGRDFADWERMCTVLDAIKDLGAVPKGTPAGMPLSPIDVVIHGAAPGADTLAGSWAESRGIKVRAVPALWRLHGNSAGPIRNQSMLSLLRLADGDYVIAFRGGKGTAHMKDIARRKGFTVVEIL